MLRGAALTVNALTALAVLAGAAVWKVPPLHDWAAHQHLVHVMVSAVR